MGAVAHSGSVFSHACVRFIRRAEGFIFNKCARTPPANGVEPYLPSHFCPCAITSDGACQRIFSHSSLASVSSRSWFMLSFPKQQHCSAKASPLRAPDSPPSLTRPLGRALPSFVQTLNL